MYDRADAAVAVGDGWAGCVQMIVNGILIGRVPYANARDVVAAIRGARLQARIYDAAVWGDDENTVHVSTGDGRVLHPVYVAAAATARMPDVAEHWDALVAAGAIEYLDANEVGNRLGAQRASTHHPATPGRARARCHVAARGRCASGRLLALHDSPVDDCERRSRVNAVSRQ
jgi:hypothetical protein